MLLARNAKEPTIVQEGISNKQLTAYASDQGHYSLPKAVNFVGIGKNNLRTIKSDKYGRLDIQALEKQIKEDIYR